MALLRWRSTVSCVVLLCASAAVGQERVNYADMFRLNVHGKETYLIDGSFPVSVSVTVLGARSYLSPPDGVGLPRFVNHLELFYPSGKNVMASLRKPHGEARDNILNGGNLVWEAGAHVDFPIDLADYFDIQEEGNYRVEWWYEELPESAKKKDGKVVIWAPGMKKVTVASFSFVVRKVTAQAKREVKAVVYFPQSFFSSPRFGSVKGSVFVGTYRTAGGGAQQTIGLGGFEPFPPSSRPAETADPLTCALYARILCDLFNGSGRFDYVDVPAATEIVFSEMDFKGLLWLHLKAGGKQAVLVWDPFSRSSMFVFPWSDDPVLMMHSIGNGRQAQVSISATDGNKAVTTLSLARALVRSADVAKFAELDKEGTEPKKLPQDPEGGPAVKHEAPEQHPK